jgi:ABC-type transport system involved in multi-copper enzyme maturation permease subunit
MSVIARLLPDNPVLTKELRVRMRGARAYWILFGYLGFLSAVLLIQYAAFLGSVQSTGSGASEVSRVGESIFNAVVLTQLFLVLFITPAITSGALTIEREQQTMDLLTLTRIPRRSIIAGKLLSAVAFTSLLLVSSLPLISISFMLGSVDPGMVISVYMMLLMASVFIGAMGLMWSSIARTTTQAVMYTYATLFVLFLVGAVNFMGNYAMGSGSYHSGYLIENIFLAFGMTWFSNRFFGITGPEGLGFSVLCLLMALLMATVARVRLEMYPERQGGLLRVLTASVIGVQVFAANLWWLDAWYNRAGKAVQLPVQPPLAALIITAMLLMLVVPVFATGELAPDETRGFGKYLASGWNPKNLRLGKMASGLPYLLLLTLFCLGLFAFSFVTMGKESDIGRSGLAATTKSVSPPAVVTYQTTVAAPPTVTTVNGKTTVTSQPNKVQQPPPPPAIPHQTGDFREAAIVLFASVAGFALFCQFLSALCRNRWVAWLFATMFLGLVWIVPAIARGSASQYSPPGMSVNLHYFNPVVALCQMADNFNHAQYLMFETTHPIWQVTTMLWLVVGATSLLFTFALVARQKRQLA